MTLALHQPFLFLSRRKSWNRHLTTLVILMWENLWHIYIIYSGISKIKCITRVSTMYVFTGIYRFPRRREGSRNCRKSWWAGMGRGRGCQRGVWCNLPMVHPDTPDEVISSCVWFALIRLMNPYQVSLWFTIFIDLALFSYHKTVFYCLCRIGMWKKQQQRGQVRWPTWPHPKYELDNQTLWSLLYEEFYRHWLGFYKFECI